MEKVLGKKGMSGADQKVYVLIECGGSTKTATTFRKMVISLICEYESENDRFESFSNVSMEIVMNALEKHLPDNWVWRGTPDIMLLPKKDALEDGGEIIKKPF
jgi:hypothetical protein